VGRVLRCLPSADARGRQMALREGCARRMAGMASAAIHRCRDARGLPSMLGQAIWGEDGVEAARGVCGRRTTMEGRGHGEAIVKPVDAGL
jgi:hypothetical protein